MKSVIKSFFNQQRTNSRQYIDDIREKSEEKKLLATLKPAINEFSKSPISNPENLKVQKYDKYSVCYPRSEFSGSDSPMDAWEFLHDKHFDHITWAVNHAKGIAYSFSSK